MTQQAARSRTETYFLAVDESSSLHLLWYNINQRSMRFMLWLCFALSGAAALALEMLWMRSAGLVLGTTAFTAATVLACYFAGLGLGSVYARRASSRPVRLYGYLEFGAAAGALWSLTIFRVLALDNAQVWLSNIGLAGRVAAVALAILPTTFCLRCNASDSCPSSCQRRDCGTTRRSPLRHQHRRRCARRGSRGLWPSHLRRCAGELRHCRRRQFAGRTPGNRDRRSP